MKSQRPFPSLCLLLSIASLAAVAAQERSGVVPGSVLLASAEGVSVFDRAGSMTFGKFSTTLVDGMPEKLEWSDMIYDGWRLPSGNYLCSAHEWVREISPDGRIAWEYRVQKPVELKTCLPLPNGDVMMVDGERMELIQLSNHGRKIVKRIPVPTNPKVGIHSRYNLLRRTLAGTYLLALRAEKAFIEVDESGKELWRHPVPGLPVVAERLPSGNTLFSWRGSSAESHGGLIEVGKDHQIVWELSAEEVDGFHGWFGGFHRFENGNTLIANSDWHYREAKETAMQVFEVTRNKKVVWKLGVEAFAGKKPGSLEPRTGLVEQRIIGLQWLGASSAVQTTK